jgi:hypothetical protein
MKYNKVELHPTAKARFGEVETPIGKFQLPRAAPAIRTSLDVEALLENVRAGMPLGAVAPYASYGASLGMALAVLKQPIPPAGLRGSVRPLFVADPESEALSLNCLARSRFLKRSPVPGAAVHTLLNTGLRSDSKPRSDGKPPQVDVHSAWRQFERLYGLTPLVGWTGSQLLAVHSDVLSLPTPIVRDDLASVEQSIGLATRLVQDARQVSTVTSQFKMVGPHFLFHGEIFAPNSEADSARAAFLRGVRSWGPITAMGDIVLSFKVHDQPGVLTDNDKGSRARQNLSEFVEGLHQAVDPLGGLLVAHNWDNWVLGLLDSGADIASFRVTGPRRIDMPTRGRKPGISPVPPLFLERALVDEDVALVMAYYRKHGAFPKPDCVPIVEYWNLDSHTERTFYTARVKCGVLVELGKRYLDAGKDKEKILSEAVRSIIADSRIRQELSDLCPSA